MLRLLPRSELSKILPLLHQVQSLHAKEMPEIFHTDASDDDYLGHWEDGFDTQDAFVIVFEADDLISGFLYACADVRPKSAFQHARRELVLDQICVDARHRRKGVATALLAEFEMQMHKRGFTQWRATHWAFNAASARLLARSGAEESVILRRKSCL